MALLGVNIDHVATLREQRHTIYPDPVEAALAAEKAGATGITAHLREDRRHIQDDDIFRLRQAIGTKLNLEMAAVQEMVEIARQVGPDEVCLVPEKREELTTEGGLDVLGREEDLQAMIEQLQARGIKVSLFIEPDPDQIAAARRCRADLVELHTGTYANASGTNQSSQLERLKKASQTVIETGMGLNAGHGLHAGNVKPVADIAGMGDLNIGHSIVARAVLVGFEEAVREMLIAMGADR